MANRHQIEQEAANQAILDSVYEDREKLREKTKLQTNKQYGDDLQQQFIEQQQKKQSQHDQALMQQHRVMDRYIKTVADNEKKELQHKQDNAKTMYDEMINCQQARETQRKEQKDFALMEDKQIAEQQKFMNDRSSQEVAERVQKLRVKDEYEEKGAVKAHADEVDRQDREDSYDLLQEHEKSDRYAREDIAEHAKSEHAKLDLKHALTAQIEDKKRLVIEEREKDAEFRRCSEITMAAEDEADKERDRKKREVQDQYREDLRKQIEDNAARKKRQHEFDEIEDNEWYNRNDRGKEVAEPKENEEEDKETHESDSGDSSEADNNQTTNQLAELKIESVESSNEYNKFY